MRIRRTRHTFLFKMLSALIATKLMAIPHLKANTDDEADHPKTGQLQSTIVWDPQSSTPSTHKGTQSQAQTEWTDLPDEIQEKIAILSNHLDALSIVEDPYTRAKLTKRAAPPHPLALKGGLTMHYTFNNQAITLKVAIKDNPWESLTDALRTVFHSTRKAWCSPVQLKIFQPKRITVDDKRPIDLQCKELIVDCSDIPMQMMQELLTEILVEKDSLSNEPSRFLRNITWIMPNEVTAENAKAFFDARMAGIHHQNNCHSLFHNTEKVTFCFPESMPESAYEWMQEESNCSVSQHFHQALQQSECQLEIKHNAT